MLTLSSLLSYSCLSTPLHSYIKINVTSHFFFKQMRRRGECFIYSFPDFFFVSVSLVLHHFALFISQWDFTFKPPSMITIKKSHCWGQEWAEKESDLHVPLAHPLCERKFRQTTNRNLSQDSLSSRRTRRKSHSFSITKIWGKKWAKNVIENVLLKMSKQKWFKLHFKSLRLSVVLKVLRPQEWTSKAAYFGHSSMKKSFWWRSKTVDEVDMKK